VAQQVQVQLIDDLDGSEAVETITFALDGVGYELDLNAKNAEKLRSALAKYVAAARRVRGTRRGRNGSGRAAKTSAVDLATVREWARANGFDVSDRGRVAGEVLDAYNAAR
jgi:hypothetical protein